MSQKNRNIISVNLTGLNDFFFQYSSQKLLHEININLREKRVKKKIGLKHMIWFVYKKNSAY